MKEIESYEWTTDELMLADLLTKEKKTKEGFDELITDNKSEVVNKGFNKVTEDGGEFLMTNIKTKDDKPALGKKSEVCSKQRGCLRQRKTPGNHEDTISLF